MNNRFFFVLACLVCFVLNASAQFSNNGSSNATISDNSGWNTIYVEWNPSTMSFSGNNKKIDFYGGFTGFSIGYSRTILISQKLPLFVDAGVAWQFSFKSKSESSKRNDESTKLSLLSLKLPVNLVYKFDIPNCPISLMPFVGVTFRGNVWGKMKWKEYDNYYEENDDYSASLFDKHDMGYLVGYHIQHIDYDKYDYDYTWKRLQMGWQAGLKAYIANKFIVSGSYGTDFNEIVKDYKVHTGTVSVGYTF